MAISSSPPFQKTRRHRRKVSQAPVLWKSKYRRLRQLGAWRRLLADNRAGAITVRKAQATFKCAEKSSTRAQKKNLAKTVLNTSAGSSVEKRPLCNELVDGEMQKRVEKRACAPETTHAACGGETIQQMSTVSQSSFRPLGSRFWRDPSAAVLALTVSAAASGSQRKAAKKSSQASVATSAPPAKPKLDVSAEIQRILAVEGPEQVLNIGQGENDEDVVSQAWKRLVLLLHPDKLQCLDEKSREAGADALHIVHNAKEEMKRRSQESCAEVPLQPIPDGSACLLDGGSGSRKYEVKWKIPETVDPQRPVEKYEVWGAKYFSQAGDSFDWVLLATLPALQTHFVLVEEAPTQQDVMWAADRVRRQTLPLSVQAVNGKGSSEALTFEMPWARSFPWLQGTQSVVCPRCCQLSQRRGAYSKCGGCGFSVPAENALILRCPDCQGEVLWSHAGSQLSCTCCLKKLGGASAQEQWKKPRQPMGPPPQHGSGPQSSPRWGPRGGHGGGYGGGGRSGGRPWY